MKKIFIVTGEPSGDKLASAIISKLKKNNPNIEYLSVGGTHIQSLGVKSIFDLKEITYLGFTSVLFNIFKIRKRINKTVEEIIKFQPDILLMWIVLISLSELLTELKKLIKTLKQFIMLHHKCGFGEKIELKK